MCVDVTTGIKKCTCGDMCGKELSKAKAAAKEHEQDDEKQERYHEYIKRMYHEIEENDA